MSAPIKVQSIPHAIFESTRSWFIRILNHFSVLWKITPLYFLAQTLYTLDKKSPPKRAQSENSPNSSFHIWNHKLVFLETLHYSSVSWEIIVLYFFSWNLVQFGRKGKIKVQNFRLSTAHVKFHQICTLIGSFCWNYINFQLKKYMSYSSWHWRMMQNLKKNQFLVSKIIRTWWILIQALKSLKKLHFKLSLSCKVCKVWPKTEQRSYRSWNWSVMKSLKKQWVVV